MDFSDINIFSGESKVFKAIKRANKVLETIQDIPNQLRLASEGLANEIQSAQEEIDALRNDQADRVAKAVEVENIISGINKLFGGKI